MRAAMYYSNNDVRIEEMPKPEIGAGELLVKVMASGICGSDVMEWYRLKKAPLILGHEVAGEVVEAGAGVEKFKKGDRVFATHHVPCNECHFCRKGEETVCETLRKTKFYPGGFAEFLRVPKENVEKGTLLLPEGMGFEAGTFIEPLGCVVRGQRKAGMKEGLSVLVLGSGMSGLLHIQLAKAWGADKVFATDISQFHLKAAEKFGADKAFNAKQFSPQSMKALNEGRLADLVIVCTAAPAAIEQAFESVEKGGTILFFAVPSPGTETTLDLNEIWMKNLTLTNTYAAAGEDLTAALGLIRDGKINVKDLITHRLPLSKAGQGFKLVAEAQESIKIIIEPQK